MGVSESQTLTSKPTRGGDTQFLILIFFYFLLLKQKQNYNTMINKFTDQKDSGLIG